MTISEVVPGFKDDQDMKDTHELFFLSMFQLEK